jgi:trk system potassium uptake protein TrkA
VHFVIMGCGRVGVSLARALERSGHDVAVIDQDPTAFRRLGTSFEGQRVTGLGFDRDTLREARITEAYAFAAVSSGDNSNILAARVAREKFGVENVVARIYDPGRAEIYQGRIVMAEIPISSAWVGQRLSALESATGGRVAYVTRLGEGLLPDPNTVHQQGDLVHLLLPRDLLASAERALDSAPPAH